MHTADRSGVKDLLAAVPLGILAISFLCDVLYLASDQVVWAGVGYWDLTVGLVGGLIGCVFALVELRTLPPATRAARAGVGSAALQLAGLTVFTSAFAIRTLITAQAPTPVTLALAGLGLSCAAASVWFGAPAG